MTYESFVISATNEVIAKEGGARAAARKLGVDVSIISKMSRGKLVPKKETFAKWFGIDPIFIVELERAKEIYTIYCVGLDQLKDDLKRLGYELKIEKIQA